MPTGAGKTTVAIGFVMALYRLGAVKDGDIILYLTPRIILKGQVEKEFKKAFSIFRNRPNTIWECDYFRIITQQELKGDMQGKLKHYLDEWNEDRIAVLIYTPQTLHDFIRRYRQEICRFSNIKKKRLRIVLMDEIHRIYFGPKISESINYLINNLSPECVIGFSATPIRQAVEHIGDILYRLSSLDAMREGILVRRLRIYSTETYTKLAEGVDEDEWSVAVIERAELYSNEILRRLSDEVREIYNLPSDVDPLTKRIPKTLIVAANTTEANEIAERLREKLSKRIQSINIHDLVRVAHYKIEGSLNELEDFKKQDQGILVTVNMADMGFNDKNLEALVIARPVRTPIAYVQIRGRVLRNPNNPNNIKARRYAILIDLTGSARHEESVEDVELGRFRVGTDEIESDLKGRDEVKKVHGEVTVNRKYEIIEVPPEETSLPSTIPVEKLREEILRVLRLPYGLTTESIRNELQRRGLNVSSTYVERVCRELAEEGKLTRRYDTWFYDYEARINDILSNEEREYRNLEELMERAGIPFKDRDRVIRILNNLRRHASVLIITRGTKKNISLNDLGNFLQNIAVENDWIIIRYPVKLKLEVKRHLTEIQNIGFWNIIESDVSENMHQILLKRVIAIFETQRSEIPCSNLEEAEVLLINYDVDRIKIPPINDYKRIIRGIVEIAHSLGFRIKYDFDVRRNMIEMILS